MTQHLIIGAGEVGQALHEVLTSPRRRPNDPYHDGDDTYLIDIDPLNKAVVHPPVEVDGKAWGPDVLHIAFGYSASFIQEVNRYSHHYDPDLIVVHSTTPVDTCWKLIRREDVVHSPVRGRHPHLAEGIQTFVKHFGGPRAEEAAVHFSARGIETSTTRYSANTEAGKLWEMVQFAVNIAMEKEITRYCEAYGMDRDVVYTEFAATYNEGYADLDLYQFIRPILEHMPGPIGGHCVMPSLEWLSFSNPGIISWLQDWLADLTGETQGARYSQPRTVPANPSKLTFNGQDVHEPGFTKEDADQVIRGWLEENAQSSAKLRAITTPEVEDTPTQRSRPSLEETDPNLISQLKVMGDNWGPLGVAEVAALLTDTDLLVKALTGKLDSPDQCSPYCAGGHTVGCPNNSLED